MDEEKKNTETKGEETKAEQEEAKPTEEALQENTEAGRAESSVQARSMIEEARSAALKIERANAETRA